MGIIDLKHMLILSHIILLKISVDISQVPSSTDRLMLCSQTSVQ